MLDNLNMGEHASHARSDRKDHSASLRSTQHEGRGFCHTRPQFAKSSEIM
jgi:hypothetical protein